MATWQDEYKTMIADCKKRESKLTDWDIDFINSLSKQLDNGRVFSQKQIEKLDQIWERATKNG